MALPSTGTITMGQVRAELRKNGSLNLGNTDVRTVAEKPSGTIKMSDLHGKTGWIESVSFDIGVTFKKTDDWSKTFFCKLGLSQRNIRVTFMYHKKSKTTSSGHTSYSISFHVSINGLENNEKAEIKFNFGYEDYIKTFGNCEGEGLAGSTGAANNNATINTIRFFIQ
ncbi:hypothetical protein I6E31_12375 [Fusobacterium varium]|nr:hypothetical protein [Fusobacterium varium]